MSRTEIRGGQIKDETVDSADIASGSIKAGEISVQAITGQPSLDPADATNDRLLIWDSGADTLKKVSPENLGVTAAAAGSDGQVQYNNGGTATGGASGLYWDDANDRVGIGTSTPAYTLDVAGDIGGDGSITVANSVTASNGIKSDGVNQFTGGSCFSPTVFVTSSIKYYPQVLSWQHYALPVTGAFVIHTNITASSDEMFEIKVHGYNYQGAGMIDFTIGGYAYAYASRSEGDPPLLGSVRYGSITDNGSDGYRKWLGMDADGYVSIAIGDYDMSHQRDHYFWSLSADFWSLRNMSNPYEGDPWSVELSAVEGFGWTDIRGVYGQAGVPMTAPITSKATWGNSWVMINTGSSGGASNPPLYTLDVNGDIRVSDDLFVDDFASLDSCRIGTTQTDPGTGNLVVEGIVGIGTDSPGATLDILGDTSSDQLRLGFGGTNYYKIGRNSSTGFLDFQGNQGGYTGYTFKNHTGSTDLTILDSGYVGIGTASPTHEFEVYPDEDITAIIGCAFVGHSINDAAAAFGHRDLQGNAYALYQSAAGLTILNTGVDQAMHFRINNSTKATLDSNGQFGIGTTTPNSTFQVSGSQAGNYTAITDNITLNETHYIVDLTDTDDATVTLPAASGVTGRTYHILTTGNSESSWTLTIDSNGGQFMGSNQGEGPEDSIEIDGSSQSVTLVSTGTYWFILTDNRQSHE